MKSTFIRITTRWSSGPGEPQWRDLGHPLEVGQELPSSLLDELRHEIRYEMGTFDDNGGYRGCEIVVMVPPLGVVQAELASQVIRFKAAEEAVRRLDELVAELQRGQLAEPGVVVKD